MPVMLPKLLDVPIKTYLSKGPRSAAEAQTLLTFSDEDQPDGHPVGATAPTPVQPPCVCLFRPTQVRRRLGKRRQGRAPRHQDDNGGGSTGWPHPSDGYVGSLVVTPCETPR